MSTEPKIVLTYFGFPGRGQSIRFAFRIGKIPFEDRHIDFPTFGKEKAEGKFPLGSIPVLDINGQRYCESNSLTRFAGKLANLYPHCPLQALRVDEIMDMVEDLMSPLGPTFAMAPADRDAARLKLIASDGAVFKIMAVLAKRQKENGNDRMVGRHLTIADCKIAAMIGMFIGSGAFDGIPKTWLSEQFPEFAAVVVKLLADVEAAAK